MTQAQPGFGNDNSRHSASDASSAPNVLADYQHHWHPDMSRERADWKDFHSQQKDADLALSSDGSYTLKKGDTLYDVARRLLKGKNESTSVSSINRMVGEILQENFDSHPELKTNPDLIHPGLQLKLPGTGESATTLSIPPLAALQASRKSDMPAVPEAPVTSGQVVERNTVAPESTDSASSIKLVNGNDVQPVAAKAPSAPEIYSSYAALDLSPPASAPSQNSTSNEAALAKSANEQISLPPLELQSATTGDTQPTPGDGAAVTYPYNADSASLSTVTLTQGEALDYVSPQSGTYIDQEATRLSAMMVDNPHMAADELRDQLSQLDPRSAGMLISQTKNDERVGGLGDLQIQAEFDRFGSDTGFRDVTMATPDGIVQIAELQSQPASYSGADPLGFVAGVTVGDLLWQQQRGVDFNDERYRSWCNREQEREASWYSNNGQFVQNWQDQNYRNQYQSQNWQQVAINPTTNNTYITINRYDTTIDNKPINTTIVNETIGNTSRIVNSAAPNVSGENSHGLNSVAQATHAIMPGRFPQVRPGEEAAKTAHSAPSSAQPQRAALQLQAEAAREKAQQQHAEAAKEKAVQHQQQQAEIAREKSTQQQVPQSGARIAAVPVSSLH
jgi:hypothetical protein